MLNAIGLSPPFQSQSSPRGLWRVSIVLSMIHRSTPPIPPETHRASIVSSGDLADGKMNCQEQKLGSVYVAGTMSRSRQKTGSNKSACSTLLHKRPTMQDRYRETPCPSLAEGYGHVVYSAKAKGRVTASPSFLGQVNKLREQSECLGTRDGVPMSNNTLWK